MLLFIFFQDFIFIYVYVCMFLFVTVLTDSTSTPWMSWSGIYRHELPVIEFWDQTLYRNSMCSYPLNYLMSLFFCRFQYKETTSYFMCFLTLSVEFSKEQFLDIFSCFPIMPFSISALKKYCQVKMKMACSLCEGGG